MGRADAAAGRARANSSVERAAAIPTKTPSASGARTW
jgi:hypothetical protein